jgi:glutamine amidotransferase PdxT
MRLYDDVVSGQCYKVISDRFKMPADDNLGNVATALKLKYDANEIDSVIIDAPGGESYVIGNIVDVNLTRIVVTDARGSQPVHVKMFCNEFTLSCLEFLS